MTALEIDKISISERIQAMEYLWDSLLKQERPGIHRWASLAGKARSIVAQRCAPRLPAVNPAFKEWFHQGR